MSPSRRVEVVAERSQLVRQALGLARDVYADMLRDVGEEVPFIDHSLAVADLLIEHGLGDDVAAAGLLHDALEYELLELGELRERFGMKVALIVCALTEDFEIEDFDERRKELRERVTATGAEARRVFAAEKTANVIETRDAYVLMQEDLDQDLPLTLDEQILVWEFDMEALFEAEEDKLTTRLSEELLGLWDQRCTQMRAESG
jgi:HD domain